MLHIRNNKACWRSVFQDKWLHRQLGSSAFKIVAHGPRVEMCTSRKIPTWPAHFVHFYVPARASPRSANRDITRMDEFFSTAIFAKEDPRSCIHLLLIKVKRTSMFFSCNANIKLPNPAFAAFYDTRTQNGTAYVLQHRWPHAALYRRLRIWTSPDTDTGETECDEECEQHCEQRDRALSPFCLNPSHLHQPQDTHQNNSYTNCISSN